jgi:hypothetical protein
VPGVDPHRFLLNPFKFISHPNIRCYIIAIESVVKEIPLPPKIKMIKWVLAELRFHTRTLDIFGSNLDLDIGDSDIFLWFS